MVGHFNFAWQDATTFEPYEHESEANLALYKSFGKNEVQCTASRANDRERQRHS
jgi:hypothetical protein